MFDCMYERGKGACLHESADAAGISTHPQQQAAISKARASRAAVGAMRH